MIIVSIPFTGLGLFNGYRGDEWFKRRIELYNKYTAKCLAKQTNQDFIIWMQFRPEEKDNPLIKEIDVSHKTIMTFGGICIWDDRKVNEETFLKIRLSWSLPELKDLVGTEDVRLINLASDDMYSEEVVQSVCDALWSPRTALTHQLGYIYSTDDRLAEWNPTTNPPFYTLMYPNADFLDPELHYKFLEGFHSHEDIVKVFNPVRMPDRRYLVLVHNANISTAFSHPFRQNEIYNEETKNKILTKFFK
ncbi:hypothetical protein M0R04_13020 [Candidatus Dojkabacteria bacterium]|nr:hypothetical protein [Candidatus Dojkabacteria bacterium]